MLVVEVGDVTVAVVGVEAGLGGAVGVVDGGA